NDTDVLVLTDIDSDEVQLSRSGDDLLIYILGTDDVITVVNHFSYRLPDNNTAGGGIEQIRFADLVWDRAAIQKAAWIRGTDGRDMLDDISSNAQLDDTFIAGKGNDVIHGGRGSNTFVYAAGDGNDVIFDDSNNNSAPNAIDTLKLTGMNF